MSGMASRIPSIKKKTSKLRAIGLCESNSPVTGEFPAQRVSYAESVSIWWRRHADRYKLQTYVRVMFWNVTREQIQI